MDGAKSRRTFDQAMKLLLDTDIFLEAIPNQPQALNVRRLLNDRRHELFLSVFSLHSIGVNLLRRQLAQRWQRFLQEMVLSGQVQILTLPLTELMRVLLAIQQYSLDFDDAYQYLTAEHFQLTLVSFDRDFDKTPRGRQTPRAILQLNPNPTP
jgi:uncharacterized protein